MWTVIYMFVNMRTWKVWCVFGLFLLSSSFVRCEDNAEDAEDTKDDSDTGDDAKPAGLNIEEDNDVLVLTTDNFDSAIDANDVILVEFYAPWCGHCKTLAPEFEKAAKTLKTSDPPVALGKVDATIEKDLASRFGVSGYPTLKFFKKGEVNDYDGPRDDLGITQYMQEKADPNWQPPPPAVVTLNKDNFEDFINDNELSLVQFYAPWCGHCKKLAPEYEKAAQQLVGVIPLGKVDATEESDLGQQYKVTGYPTMKVFRAGKDYEYKGERNSGHDIVTYMRGQQGSASKLQTSLKALQKAASLDDVTIIAFFGSETDVEYTMYDEYANSVRDEYTLLHTYDSAARDYYKANTGSLIVLIPERFQSKYEPKWSTFNIKGVTDSADLAKFVSSKELPLVGQLTSANKNKRYVREGQKPLVVFFYDVDWSFDYRVASEKKRQLAVKLAKDYPDLTFAVTDEKESSDLFKDFGFDESSEDLNIGVLSAGGSKYPMEPMEDGFESDLVKEFLQSYKKGNLKPKLKSQKPPKKQGAVKVIVGDTFEKIVLDKKKDVLIEFYAPWCGHCKTLEPKYKTLAKNLKKEKNLVIAKMDATANEAPEQFVVKGYPTMYFVPANNKAAPIQYNGKNEVDELTDFMKQNAAVSFKSKDEL